jgi:putative membrane protein
VADCARAVALLQSKTGAEFDRAYLQHEVAFHQSVVDAVKHTLLPAIKNDELRNLMNTVLPGFEHHLAATKAIAMKMGVK